MRRETRRVLFLSIISVNFLLALSSLSEGISQATEKVLSLENIFRTTYALSADTAALKEIKEAIYLSKGDIKKALATLKDIVIEKRRPERSFTKQDSVNIIVFRGVLPFQGKVEITKLVSKGNDFEIYAKYTEFSGLDIPSEPAAIIPLGKLPSGKYSVALYVDDKIVTKTDFDIKK